MNTQFSSAVHVVSGLRYMFFIPSATCIELLAAFCLSSSELEEVVLEDDRHLRLTVIGTLQLSRYLQKREQIERRERERERDINHN